jgi:hypothetical protein
VPQEPRVGPDGVNVDAAAASSSLANRRPELEVEKFIAARVRFAKRSPMDIYKDEQLKLWLAREVAIEVLHVPVSEARSERDFGIADGIHTRGRASLVPETTDKLAFLKINKALLKNK